MPYIHKQYRPAINKIIKKLEKDDSVRTEGDLNYLITQICLWFSRKRGLSYSTINMVMGVLSCVAREYYRRVASVYEDEKIEQNGDLPEFKMFPKT